MGTINTNPKRQRGYRGGLGKTSLLTLRVGVMAVLWLLTASALAANVDLTTLPRRATVQLTIYNSEDITLVRETRFITLKTQLLRPPLAWTSLHNTRQRCYRQELIYRHKPYFWY